MSVHRVLVRLTRGLVVPFLALWLLTPFSPLNLAPALAPVGMARAAGIDDLGKCLDAATSAASMGQTMIDAAAKIAEAAADPKYIACLSAAGAGDLVTIGFMGAVTALYASGALGDMHNPEQCVEAIKSTMMGWIAGKLDEFLTGGGLGQSLLEALLPSDAVKFINEIVTHADGVLAQQATDALWDVLGMVTSKIECGCAAAGTAAIIKDTYDDLKAKVDEVIAGAEGCLDILKDPFGFLASALTNPGKTLQVIGEAACNGIKKTGVDLCGAFAEAGSVLYGFFQDMGHAAWEGARAFGCYVTGGIWGCDESAGDTPPPPPTCATSPENANKASDACVCPANMGTKAIKVANGCNSSIPYEQMNAADKYSCSMNMTYIDKKYCAPCDQYSILNSFGSCQTCPAGLMPGTDGTCSKPVVCNKAAGEFVGADGHTCATCPDGTTLGTNGKCNANPAVCSAWPWLKPQSGKAPTGITLPGDEPQVLGLQAPGNGDASWCACPAGLVNTGSACVKPDPVTSRPCALNWQLRDPKTGVCRDRCAPDQFYGPQPQNVEVKADICQACPAGQLAYQNTCVERCTVDEKRSALGSCLACASNMTAGGKKNAKGEYTQCVFACAAGQSYIDGVCTAACKSDQIRVEVGFGTGTPTPSCIACPAGTRAAGDPNGLGEHTACVNDCPAGTAYQTTDVKTGSLSFGGNKAGGVSASFAACMVCAAGTYPQTTKKTAFNATVETMVCAACPATTTSDAGDAACHGLGVVTVSLPPGSKIPPVGRKTVETPVYHPPTANTGNRPARPERTAPPERASPPKQQAQPGKLQCRAGMVPNKAGTRCIVDLDAEDDRPGGGGGSTAPAGRGGGRGTTGSGGFTTFNRN